VSSGIEELLDHARRRLRRLDPRESLAAQDAGAILVDIRGDDQVRAGGTIPGAVRIQRNVLEWRADATSPWRDARLGDDDALLVLVCQEGYQSSLAAATLLDLGRQATDMDGGFEAWAALGLPVEPVAAADVRSVQDAPVTPP
jgi:rhodanese-related sulfurtransferase